MNQNVGKIVKGMLIGGAVSGAIIVAQMGSKPANRRQLKRMGKRLVRKMGF